MATACTFSSRIEQQKFGRLLLRVMVLTIRDPKQFSAAQLLHARHPLVQFGAMIDPHRGTLVGLHENEKVYYAVVESSRFGVYRRSYRLNARVFGAGRF